MEGAVWRHSAAQDRERLNLAALQSTETFVHLRSGAHLHWWPRCICCPKGASISVTIKPPLQG